MTLLLIVIGTMILIGMSVESLTIPCVGTVQLTASSQTMKSSPLLGNPLFQTVLFSHIPHRNHVQSSFQRQRQPQRRRRCCYYTRLYSTKTDNDVENNTKGHNKNNNDNVALLQDKVSILQDVVMELHRRQETSKVVANQIDQEHEQVVTELTEQWEDLRKTNQQLMEKIQRLELEQKDVESQIRKVEDEYKWKQAVDDSIMSARTQFDEQLLDLQSKHDQTVRELHNQIHTYEIERKRLVEEWDEKSTSNQQMIDSLQAQVSNLKEAAAVAVEEATAAASVSSERQQQLLREAQQEQEWAMKRQAEAAADELRLAEEKHKNIVEDYKAKIKDLSSEVQRLFRQRKEEEVEQQRKDIVTATVEEENKKQQQQKWEEQMEIATAAVNAAQRREMKLQDEATTIQQQLQQKRVQTKLLRLAIDSFKCDNVELEDENAKLKESLVTTKEKVAALQDYINQENAKRTKKKSWGIWKSIRSKFSKR